MNISILGCGWLGLPLARHLLANGHTIKGSTTDPEKLDLLTDNGIQPYLINLNPELQQPESIRSFWESEVLVINIPPGRRRENVIDFHTRQMESVNSQLGNSSISLVVFVSSTSVYPSNPGRVTEGDTIPGKAGRASGNALLQVEALLRGNEAFDTTVVRFGGLIGGERHPGNYLAGKRNLRRGDAPVNLIHRDDCITILTQIADEHISGEMFNAVADEHPTRRDYYQRAAEQLGVEPPQFKAHNELLNHKIIANDYLKATLGYTFEYPDPLEMI